MTYYKQFAEMLWLEQGIFTKYLIADNDNATEERIGGIGSTGKGN